jgi:hypothetical protein
MREHMCDIFQKYSHQPWIIHQDHQELSQTNHNLPNKLTKTYIAVDAKSAPSAKHTTSRTSLLHT